MVAIPDGNVPETQKKSYEKPLTEVMTNIDKVNVSDNNLAETLAGLKTDMEDEISEVFKDKKVTEQERSRMDMLKTSLCGLNGKIKMALAQSNGELKAKYEELAASLSETIKRVTDASNGKDPNKVVQKSAQNQYAPTTTDAESNREYNPNPTMNKYIKKDVAMVSDRMFKDDERILKEYNGIFRNPTYGKIAAQLKLFQAKYSERIKQQANTVDGNEYYKFTNLYDQISGQIAYYENLAKNGTPDAFSDIAAKPRGGRSDDYYKAWGASMLGSRSDDTRAKNIDVAMGRDVTY